MTNMGPDLETMHQTHQLRDLMLEWRESLPKLVEPRESVLGMLEWRESVLDILEWRESVLVHLKRHV